MEIGKDILNELNGLSPVLAGAQKVNVFTVPNGYFEKLAANILLDVKAEEGSLINSISGRPVSAEVPKGYFESLAATILSKIKEEESVATELKGLSPILHSIESKNVFSVPLGYFKSLHSVIVSKKNKEETAAELNDLSTVLHGIKDKNVYTVPGNYFETLSDKIEDAVKPQQVKVVTMRKRSITTLLKYAAAAVFTGAMFLGVYNFIGKGKVSSTGSLTVAQTEGLKIAAENRFDAELAKITDTDIVKYLEDNGSDVDAALVANTINEDELPTEEDYLTDDKALDKYLDNIDINDLKN
jgi:major membrane immunogen (membrane-anchored lipoprotein)